MEAVTDILIARSRRPEGFSRMATASVLAHVLIAAALLLVPSMAVKDEGPKTVMQISLGPAAGPNSGGMTALSDRPVQAPPPPTPEPVKRAPEPMPVPKAPEMALPTPKAKPAKPTVKPVIRDAPKESTSRTPTRGEQPREGTAKVDTGTKTTGFGLSTGGGTGGFLDVANFCCPEYLTTMLQLIQRNWNSRQDVAGQTQVKFTVQRDGRITDVLVEQSSGYFALDQGAERALLLTRQLPPLPAQFPEPQLTVHLIFRYQR